MRYAVVAVVLALAAGGAARGAEELTEAERKRLEAQAARMNAAVVAAYQQGKAEEAARLAEEALNLARRLYPLGEFPNGHSALADSLNNLSMLRKSAGKGSDALELAREALRIRKQLNPEGDSNIANSLNNIGKLQSSLGDLFEAESSYREAEMILRKLYPPKDFPDGHPHLAIVLDNLSETLADQGRYAHARRICEAALAMRRNLYSPKRFPNGHREIARSLDQLAELLITAGELGPAERLLLEARKMRNLTLPDEHPERSASDVELGRLMLKKGEFEKAEQLFRERLAFCKEKLPPKHPITASALDDLSTALRARGEQEESLRLLKEAVQMKADIYPDDHLSIAAGFNSLAVHLFCSGHGEAGLESAREAVRRIRLLYPKARYPDGHPDLANALNNLALLLWLTDKPDEAVAVCRESLAIREKLFPQGGPLVAAGLNNLGACLLADGKADEASRQLRRSLGMWKRVVGEFLRASSEAESLNQLAAMLATEEGLLDATAGPALTAEIYPDIWPLKNFVARTASERSRLAMRVADSDPETALRFGRLTGLRQDIARLVFAPADHKGNRETALRKLTDEKEALERELASILPPADPKADPVPADLAGRLPKESAFVDLWRYSRRIPGKDKLVEPYYAAFVVRPGKPVVRVELGPADPIDKDLSAWRKAIADGLASDAAGRLRAALWKPLASHLPTPGPDAVVYLSPAGSLHALPWAALPGAKADTFLLDEYAVVLTASGPDLLDALAAAPKRDGGRLLTVGGVRFGATDAPWKPLPATADEAKAVAAARARSADTDTLAGDAATPEAVLAGLPKARWAHLATHGFYAAPDTDTRKAMLDDRLFAVGVRGERRGVGARNPLVQTGLVLAGANAGGDKGLLTAEAIAGLDLRGLDLVVLSACETGLGERAGGEGVFGLQRAFHLAGTRDVVAALWPVDDEATAALMRVFYHGLWVENLPPSQALRRAQLALLRNPGDRKELATARGPNFDKVVKKATADPAPAARPVEGAARQVRFWAGFALSGVGR